jgi:IS5 family transposase
MRQTSFSSAGFDCYAKTTKREMFLAEMDRVVPWPLLCGLMAPHYPDSDPGRPAVGLDRPGGGGGVARQPRDAPFCRHRFGS